MRRFHLFELHEQSWYPDGWRKIFQRGLGEANTLTGVHESFRGPLARLLARLRPTAILDLCSGSGDAVCMTWREIAKTFDGASRPTLVLSDLYPNVESFERLRGIYTDLVAYYPAPVDALQPPEQAPKVRTLFNCFHHFRPPQARQILQHSAEHADGIAVFEVTARTWKNMIQTLLVLPFAAAFQVAFLLRPLRLTNLLWGLLLPVIPFTAVFDGLVSNLRTYTVDELREMTASLDSPNFQWEIGKVRIPRLGLDATYLLGWREVREAVTPGETAPLQASP